MKAIGKRSVASLLTLLLSVAWYAVAVGLLLAVCVTVFSLFGDLSGGEHVFMDIPASFSVDARTFHVTAPSLGIENAQFESVRANGNLKFAPPSRVFLALTAGIVSLWLALVLWVLGQLRAVFRTLRDGHPFVAANATRIRRTAYAMMLGELTRYTFALVGNHYVMRHFSAAGLRFDVRPDLNVLAIVSGLVILVIAEVFRAGARLEEEQSLTV